MLPLDEIEFEEKEHVSGETRTDVFRALLLLAPAMLMSTTGQLFLKYGMNQVGAFEFSTNAILAILPRVLTSPFIWLGFIGFMGGSVFWLSVISRVPLSLASVSQCESGIFVVIQFIPQTTSVRDPQNLDMWLDVNGQRRQTGNTRTMIFTVAQLVADVSRYMTLLPGDVIATGTPSGIGPMRPGDVVEVKVAGIGALRNRLV